MRERVTLPEKELLPLAHHAQIRVVQHDHLDADAVLHDRAQFLHRHLETSVAHHADDLAVGHAELGPQRGRQAEAHRAEPSGGDETARRVEFRVAGAEHLILADVRDDHRVALLDLGQRADRVVHRDKPPLRVAARADDFLVFAPVAAFGHVDPR